MILDAGCGEGRILKDIKEDIIGLDLNIIKLKSAKKYGKPLVLGDIRNLPFKNESFTKVLLSHVLEHIREVDIALNEVKRVTKKNGIIEIYLPSEKLMYNDKTHVWFLNLEEWKSLIGRYFKILKTESLFNLPDGVAGKLNFIPAKIRKKFLFDWKNFFLSAR
ncbi:MAG: class I SAM-dependent methyltransferase [Candidatus Aenigmatarchaeota archaeon]